MLTFAWGYESGWRSESEFDSASSTAFGFGSETAFGSAFDLASASDSTFEKEIASVS